MENKSTYIHDDTAPAHWVLLSHNNTNVIQLSGKWHLQSSSIPLFPPNTLERIKPQSPLAIDIASVTQWDSGIVAFLGEVKTAATQAHLLLDTSALPQSLCKLLSLLPDQFSASVTPHKKLNFFAWIGQQTITVLTELGALSELFFDTIRKSLALFSGKVAVRSIDILNNIRDAGPSALIIVSIVNFLVGAILAFVGAVQLRKFSADAYVANLVSIAMVRELAAVMTAIVMAGRTGGAYAARISTMLGNEEIDALTVFGIPVSSYIVLPSILALVFTMPLLYLYGCAVGMGGGLCVSLMMLNVTGAGYIHQTLGSIGINQFFFGFVKSIFFAILIALISCRIGLKSGRSASDVGHAATHAVVVGIVGVITMDAIFAVLADVVGI